jgi:hypothetical protein
MARKAGLGDWHAHEGRYTAVSEFLTTRLEINSVTR